MVLDGKLGKKGVHRAMAVGCMQGCMHGDAHGCKDAHSAKTGCMDACKDARVQGAGWKDAHTHAKMGCRDGVSGCTHTCKGGVRR